MTLLTVTQETAGARIDSFLAQNMENMSRSGVQKLILSQSVLVNGAPAGKSYIVQTGDAVQVKTPVPEEMQAQPQQIALDILYEDNDIIVVNKPSGLVVHPGAGNKDGTLVNALLYHCKGSLSGINGTIRPGIVHRLDKDTSGAMVCAKNDIAHRGLEKQVKAYSFSRIYHSIVFGHPPAEGVIDKPVGRSSTHRVKMAVNGIAPRDAVTNYAVIEHFAKHSHIQCKLQTGRTHQIRVHMASIGHPVLGDQLYAAGRDNMGLTIQCLHSKTLTITHPITGEIMTFDTELPDYFKNVLTKTGKI